MSKKLTFVAILTLATLITADVGYRLFLWIAGRPYSVTGTETEIDRIAQAMGDPLKLPGIKASRKDIPRTIHPFFGFQVADHFDPVHQVLSEPRNEEEFLILVVGGSVAEVFSREGEESFIKILKADPRIQSKTVRLLNHAHPGFKQPQQLMAVEYLLSQGYEVDAVLNLDGLNEVALGHTNFTRQMDPTFPTVNMWGPVIRGSGLSPAELDSLVLARELENKAASIASVAHVMKFSWSSILGRFTLGRLHRAQTRWAKAQEIVSSSKQRNPAMPPLRTGLPTTSNDAVELALRCWAESSRSLHAICSTRGIFYFHVLQPTLHDPGSKPLTRKELEQGTARPAWSRGVEIGYPKLRQEGNRLKSSGVPFHDASRLFSDVLEPLYIDSCHLNPRGNEMLGEDIASAFLKRVNL